jgi:Fe-S cluster assembly protein SufD
MSARAPAAAGPLAELEAALGPLPGGPAWDAWRAGALARLQALGLPTARDDAWRYSNLRLLERRALAPVGAQPLSTGPLAALPALPGARLVFVDGRYCEALSSTALPAGVAFAPLAGALAALAPGDFGERLAAPRDAVDERLRLLNGALFCDGARLGFAPGCAPAEPVSIVHLAGGGASYPRVVLDLGPGARATVIEFHLAADGSESLSCACADVALGAGAALEHLAVQLGTPHSVLLADARVAAGRDARYQHRLLAQGGQLARLDLRVALAERGASAELAGLLLADGASRVDVRTLVEHCAPRTTSAQLYRGVCGGRGRGSYDGKVIVHAGAAGADSRQSARGLLLSPQAAFDVRPQLEINAD